jgi:hypothetical protein
MKKHGIAVAWMVLSCAMFGYPAPLSAAGLTRDQAIANLAGKETEEKLLRSQLAQWEKTKADAQQKYKEAVDAYWKLADRIAQEEEYPTGVMGLLQQENIALIARQGACRAQQEMAEQQIASINARLQALAGEIAQARQALANATPPPPPNQPYQANTDPRANEPAGGVATTGQSGYVPASGKDEKTGLTTGLPGWAATTQPPAGGGDSSSGAAKPPIMGPFYPPGSGWGAQPLSWPSDPAWAWPPYLTPWPGSGSGGHTHTPGGKGTPHSGSSGGHHHGPDGRDR